MKTLALAFASLVTLSGAAMATDSITINQQSSGGVFSRNSATVNATGRGSQNVFIAQDGARSQSPRRTCARVAAMRSAPSCRRAASTTGRR